MISCSVRHEATRESADDLEALRQALGAPQLNLVGISYGTHLALAFAATHPAVTSVILGPRTIGHLTDHLAAAGVRLDDETLDRIDEIVPPGVTLNPSDADYSPPDLADSGLRRRPAGQR